MGGVLGLVLIASLFCLLMPRRRKRATEDDPRSHVFTPVEPKNQTNTGPEALRYPEDLEVDSGRVQGV